MTAVLGSPRVTPWTGGGLNAPPDRPFWNAMTTTKRLKYISRQTRTMTRDELDAIVAAARARNAECEITGALVATGNVFFQILEGPPDAVDAAFARIRADVRHTDVVCLAEQSACASRLFPAWRMERVALEGTPASAAIEAKLRLLASAETGAARDDLTQELSRLVAAEAAHARAA